MDGWKALALSLLTAGLIALVSGCSSDSVPTTAPLSSTKPSGEFQYPELTPEMLAAGPAPGYRFVTTNLEPSRTLDAVNCDSMSEARYCAAGRVNSVVIPLVTLYIPAGANPHATVVRIVAPSGCVAVADFYPHPYQFNSPVQIQWNLKALGLPAGFDYTTLVPWYLTDDGQYVPVAYQLSWDRKTLTVFTNHFSRYIIGEPDE
jgi:hypothetical protein